MSKINPKDHAIAAGNEQYGGLTKREKLIFDLYVSHVHDYSKSATNSKPYLANIAKESIRQADILFEEMNKGLK